MAQILHGIRHLLSFPSGYDLFQSIVGGRRARVRFIREFVRPFPGARILDIGCGTGKILDYLPADIEYAGLDLNPRYIEHAGRKYGKRGRFFCTDVARLNEAIPRHVKFDIILAVTILHHLNDDEVTGLFDELYHFLDEGGKIVTLDCAYVPNQSWLSRFIISKDRGQNVRTSEECRRLVSNGRLSVDSFILDDLLAIPYDHCILQITKAA